MPCFDTFNTNDGVRSDPPRWKPNDYNTEERKSQPSLYEAIWRFVAFQRISSIGKFSLYAPYVMGWNDDRNDHFIGWRTPYPSYPPDFLL